MLKEKEIRTTLVDVLPQTAVFREHGFVVERQQSIGDYFVTGFALRQ
jgi:hypothetical protein